MVGVVSRSLVTTPVGAEVWDRTAGEAERLRRQHSASTNGVSSGITGPTHRVDVVAETGLWMDRAEIHSRQLNRKEFIGRIMKFSQNQEEWWLIELRKSVLNKGNQKAGNTGEINPWDNSSDTSITSTLGRHNHSCRPFANVTCHSTRYQQVLTVPTSVCYLRHPLDWDKYCCCWLSSERGKYNENHKCRWSHSAVSNSLQSHGL